VSELRTKTEVKVNQDQLDSIEIKSMRRPMGPGFSLNPALEGSQPSGTMEVVDGTKGLSLPALTPPTPAPSPSVEN
ncbi:MAG: hypothetical protein QGG40_12265, partial [Myxococcota bacterium]|nr:hypothetical protein [Myxococcota bacterium]